MLWYCDYWQHSSCKIKKLSVDYTQELQNTATGESSDDSLDESDVNVLTEKS